MRHTLALPLLFALALPAFANGTSSDAADGDRIAPLPATEGLLPLRARGNEPGWVLDLAEDGAVWEGDYGETRIETPLPVPTETADGLHFALHPDLEVTLGADLCHDDMTGMPYPLSATLRHEDRTLSGCAGAPEALLTGAPWAIEGGGEISFEAEAEAPTTAQGPVSGTTGCNRFAGQWQLSGEGLRLGQMISTRMACPGPAMEHEATVLQALAAVDRFDIAGDGALQLIGGDAVLLVARRQD